MKEQLESGNSEESHPEHGQYLMKTGNGERLYKFYYFRPIAGRQDRFEYRILTKEKANGLLEMVSYNFKIVGGIPRKSSITRVPEISKEHLEDIVKNISSASSSALNIFTNSIEAWSNKDIKKANETINSIKPLIVACEEIHNAAIQLKGEPTVAVSYIIESIRRTGEYAVDISEITINLLVHI